MCKSITAHLPDEGECEILAQFPQDLRHVGRRRRRFGLGVDDAAAVETFDGAAVGWQQFTQEDDVLVRVVSWGPTWFTLQCSISLLFSWSLRLTNEFTD